MGYVARSRKQLLNGTGPGREWEILILSLVLIIGVLGVVAYVAAVKFGMMKTSSEVEDG